jgi:type II secretory pathway pseudopilin PulG
MKILKSRKAVSPIVGSVLVTLISIAVITLTLTVITPTINRIKDTTVINEALNNLKILDSAIREVASESVGAKRLITLQISDGSYKIDREKDQLYFDYDLKSDLRLDGKIQGIEVDSSPVYLEFFNQYGNDEIPAGWVCSGTCKIQSNKFLVSGLAYYNLNQKLRDFFLQLKIENQSGLPEAWVSPVSPESLVLFLPFDEGSGNIAYDYSGNKNNGTITCQLTECPIWSTGKYGSAMEFNRSGYIQVPHSESLNIIRNITISVWVYKE